MLPHRMVFILRHIKIEGFTPLSLLHNYLYNANASSPILAAARATS